MATFVLCVLLSVHSAFAQSTAKSEPRNSPAHENSIAAFVSDAAQRFGLPVPWINAVIHVESLGQTSAVSPKGAMGLMQIMPDTWAMLRAQYGLGDDPCDAHDNIVA
ncbi:MAG TPA: lytic transglycosylase domain-containing protein, partial [Rhizomicrobium sp.]